MSGGVEDQYLIATSDSPSGYHVNEWIKPDTLPIKYVDSLLVEPEPGPKPGPKAWPEPELEPEPEPEPEPRPVP